MYLGEERLWGLVIASGHVVSVKERGIIRYAYANEELPASSAQTGPFRPAMHSQLTSR